MYISTSSTTTSVLRLSFTARIDDGKSSSHIIDCLYQNIVSDHCEANVGPRKSEVLSLSSTAL